MLAPTALGSLGPFFLCTIPYKTTPLINNNTVSKRTQEIMLPSLLASTTAPYTILTKPIDFCQVFICGVMSLLLIGISTSMDRGESVPRDSNSQWLQTWRHLYVDHGFGRGRGRTKSRSFTDHHPHPCPRRPLQSPEPKSSPGLVQPPPLPHPTAPPSMGSA